MTTAIKGIVVQVECPACKGKLNKGAFASIAVCPKCHSTGVENKSISIDDLKQLLGLQNAHA